MKRWLSIDYGSKRIGIAITDPLKIIVTPYTTIKNKNLQQVCQELLTIFTSQNIERIIIGLPLNIEGEDTPKTLEVKAFEKKLKKITDIPIFFFDERYSSIEANDLLISKGKSIQQSKIEIDQIAAAIILENYLKTQIAETL